MSRISGSPGSIPISASTGIRRSPKASHCSRESQISLTRRLPSCAEADVVLHPLGGKATGLRQTPDTLVVLLGRQGDRSGRGPRAEDADRIAGRVPVNASFHVRHTQRSSPERSRARVRSRDQANRCSRQQERRTDGDGAVRLKRQRRHRQRRDMAFKGGTQWRTRWSTIANERGLQSSAGGSAERLPGEATTPQHSQSRGRAGWGRR